MSVSAIIDQLNTLLLPAQAHEAIELAAQGLSIEPNNAQLHYILAWIYDFIGKFEASWQHHERAIACDPKAFLWTGELAYEATRFDELETDCPLCGHGSYRVVRVVNIFRASPTHGIIRPVRRWVACLGCQQLYARPRQSLAAIEAYAKKEGDRLAAELAPISSFTKAVEADRLQFLLQQLPPQAEPPRLLDIGAAYGVFIAEALHAGLDAYGVEINPAKAYSVLKPEDHDRIRIGNVETTQLGQRTYDVVTAFDLIEHLHDPLRFMETIRTLLKPQGLLYLSTPDCRSELAVQEGREHALWLAGEHLIYFSLRGLIDFCARFGFKSLSSRPSKIIPGGVEALFQLEFSA